MSDDPKSSARSQDCPECGMKLLRSRFDEIVCHMHPHRHWIHRSLPGVRNEALPRTRVEKSSKHPGPDGASPRSITRVHRLTRSAVSDPRARAEQARVGRRHGRVNGTTRRTCLKLVDRTRARRRRATGLPGWNQVKIAGQRDGRRPSDAPPFHVPGRFASRSGTRPLEEPNLVWKDTVLVRTGETVRSSP